MVVWYDFVLNIHDVCPYIKPLRYSFNGIYWIMYPFLKTLKWIYNNIQVVIIPLSCFFANMMFPSCEGLGFGMSLALHCSLILLHPWEGGETYLTAECEGNWWVWGEEHALLCLVPFSPGPQLGSPWSAPSDERAGNIYHFCVPGMHPCGSHTKQMFWLPCLSSDFLTSARFRQGWGAIDWVTSWRLSSEFSHDCKIHLHVTALKLYFMLLSYICYSYYAFFSPPPSPPFPPPPSHNSVNNSNSFPFLAFMTAIPLSFHSSRT